MSATNVLRETAADHGSIWKAGVAAAVLAIAANVALYAAAVSLGVFPTLTLAPDAWGMGLGPVILVSTLGALGGTLVYAAVRRRVEQPIRAFLAIAAVVLVISFGGPLMIPGLTAAMIGVLEVLHVVVAVCTVGSIWRWETAARP